MRFLSPLLAGLILTASVPALADHAKPHHQHTQAAEAAWRGKIREFAKANFKHPAWGFSHCERDFELARELAAKDRVTLDEDVLFAAAYLHDMAAFPTWAKEGIDHADRAADLVADVLKDAGFPMQKLPAVQEAIRTHMYFRDPVGPEAIYLHDADALDWLGAIGVARVTALVSADGSAPDGPAVVAMLRSNLEKTPGRVNSPAGRALMPERRDELARYLDALSRQTDGYRTL